MEPLEAKLLFYCRECGRSWEDGASYAMSTGLIGYLGPLDLLLSDEAKHAGSIIRYKRCEECTAWDLPQSKEPDPDDQATISAWRVRIGFVEAHITSYWQSQVYQDLANTQRERVNRLPTRRRREENL